MDVDNPEQGDVYGESDLGDAIGMSVGAESAVNRSTGLNLDADSDQAAENFSRTAEQHHGADIEVGRADADCNFDHVQNGDVGDDRQTHHDLHAEAELHMQGDTGFGI